jgi:HEAT repeats/PBS lyase HEAT-like repeat
MIKYRLLIFTFFMFSLIIFAEENIEESKSLEEERLETIRYGIDTQVMDLIEDLESEKNYELNKDLVKLLKTSTNSRLDESIISLLDKSEDDSAVVYVFEQLKEDYNLRDNIRVVYINYISKYQTLEISEYLLDLIEEESNSVSIASINALGKSELDQIIPTLIAYLEDNLFDPLRKPAIIESLGKLKAYEALEILTDLATDIYSDDKSLRWRSVVALGEIGSAESLPVLKSLFSDEDPNLRNYTISALKNFPSEDVVDLLIQGLKDSFWKVRVKAAESLGELGSKEAVEILIYKSENDPDIRNVRSASLNALGDIGGSEAFDFIRKIYQNERTNIGLRYIAIRILAEKDLSNSLKIIINVIEEEWDKDNTLILDYTCKMLSSTKSPSLKELYLKMLSYESTYNLKLYALRGIKLNKFSSLKQEVEKLTSEETAATVKKLAIDVLKNI